jgi:hypothetical protein
MPERGTASAEVIADRYLTSPARLRERPFGPVDALDTHAGRAAQVRVLFVPGEWSEDALSEAVARWCAIGADGVTGILDYGRHRDRWYLVVPPSLGIPPQRWRTMRAPTGAEAGRLTLAFGRLLEAVAACGFPAASAEPHDFAVGPGPTAFLEQPLLEPPGTPRPIAERSAGQAVLAALFASVCAESEPAAPLQDWRRAAEAGAHPSLDGCLDALRAAVERAPQEAVAEPLGLSQIFDGEYMQRRRAPVPLQRLATLLAGLVAALSISLTLLHATGAGAGASATAAPAAVKPLVPRNAERAAPPVHAAKTPPRTKSKAQAARAHHHRSIRPRPHAVHHRSTPARSQAAAPAQRPAMHTAGPPPRPSAPAPSGSGTSLPAPGGTVLPPP